TGTVVVSNSTITGNSASKFGGGISSPSDVGLALNNSIVATNSAPSGPDLFGTADPGNNDLIGNGSGLSGLVNGVNGNLVGTAATPIDPRLAPLGNNGGPTQTMALLSGSPALGAGAADGVTTTDQRGFARVVNGQVDIGAFEDQQPTLSTFGQAAPEGSGDFLLTLQGSHFEPGAVVHFGSFVLT